MEKENLPKSPDSAIEKKDSISYKLLQDGIKNESLDSDHLGIEVISVKPIDLYEAVSNLKKYCFPTGIFRF